MPMAISAATPIRGELTRDVQSTAATLNRCDADPYDEMPYRSLPIEWSAPARLSIASLLHGGPRSPPGAYRVLELGCADGANLLPLACYASESEFVGIDGARSQIRLAQSRKSELRLSNSEFIESDFLSANEKLHGQFDYIIAHGVFSWVSPVVRDALFDLSAQRLRHGGLLYLNYNAKPGWNIRGTIRDYLLEQTGGERSLPVRARLAQELAARMAATLNAGDHPYARLLGNEFRFVCESHASYVAHEYLAADNHAYWRAEFQALAANVGLAYVCDADFNYVSGRVPEELVRRAADIRLTADSTVDTVDLLSYKQLQSPIFTQGSISPKAASTDEIANLNMAACLASCEPVDGGGHPTFRHPNGYEVEARDDAMANALAKLHPLWPSGLCIAELFADVSGAMEDILLLHRNGLVELRHHEPSASADRSHALNRLERSWGGYETSAHHVRLDASDFAGEGACGP